MFVAEAGIDLYGTPHNETSTGVAITPTRVAGADAGALMAFDATSAPAAWRWTRRSSTSTTSRRRSASPPTAASGSPCCRPAAVERIESIAASGRWVPAFLDLKIALDNSRLDQTYNTPALATILMMAEQVDWFNSQGGLAWCDGPHRRVRRRPVRLGRGHRRSPPPT